MMNATTNYDFIHFSISFLRTFSLSDVDSFIFVLSSSHSLFILYAADNFRPYLTSFQGNAFTDYINAVFVDVS
jgi:hypothetical protein